MSNAFDEIYGLMARVNKRREDAKKKGDEISLLKRHAFIETRNQSDSLHKEVQDGNKNPETAYMALLREKKMVNS